MRINHNIASLNTYRQLSTNSAAGARSLEKLSSGLRINKAGDDAAGLAISEKMRGQIRGLDQAARNSQDAISLIQTAEGALNETHSILQRMRELAVQASNDTNTDQDRSEMQREINQLTTEINRIGNTTEFNTKKLINGEISVTDKYSAYAQGTDELSAVTTILDADTKATVLSTTLQGSVYLHGTTGASVKAGAGSPTYNVAGAAGLVGPTVTAANNELSIKYNGVQYDISVAAKVYDGTAGNTADDFITDLNTALHGAGGPGANVSATLDGGKVKIAIADAAGGATNTLEIVGSGMANLVFGNTWSTDLVKTAGMDSNLTLTYEDGVGAAQSVNLTAGTYNLADLATHVQTTLNGTAGDDYAVTVIGNKLQIENTVAGSAHKMDTIAGGAATALGLTGATITAGQDANNVVDFVIDAENVSVTLSAGTYSRESLSAVLETEINAASLIADDVAVELTTGNVLKITSAEEGAGGSVSVDASVGAVALGLTATTVDDNVGVAGSNGTASDMKMQVGANNGQLMSVNISDMRAAALVISGTANSAQGVVAGARFTAENTVSNGTATAVTSAALDISTVERATAAIEVLDNATATVSSERSKLGAFQNRLEHTINNLGTSSENLTASESRIRDVDMAKEMMEFTKNNILSQAAQAMLAQANQQPQGVLQLLR